jgi:hypothetical protein
MQICVRGYRVIPLEIRAPKRMRINMTNDRWLPPQRIGLTLLICSHVVMCCLSLYYVAHFRYLGLVDTQVFHILYDPDRLYSAIVAIAAFALVSTLFMFARFSFGYFSGFYFYTMILGYIWLNCFSDLNYDHQLAGFSVAASAVAFLVPALLISSAIPQVYTLSEKGFESVLRFILLLSIATIAIGASYDFRVVNLDKIYDFRDNLESPVFINYLIGIISGSVLPFAFACFVMRRAYWLSAAALLLLLLIYPITLSKIAFFAPAWLVFIALLTHFFRARTAVVISLLGPVVAGVVLNLLFKKLAIPYFSIVNFRMIAIPSNALDIYSDYFSRHDLTHFCQITILKKIMSCPYQDPLSIVMRKAYDLGNFNASLFATEGIASVGLLLAPMSVFVCGLVIALGNRLSAGLPGRFILMSGALLPQILLNVPLTIALLTHGAAFLFLLWYITPRTMFEQKGGEQPALAPR